MRYCIIITRRGGRAPLALGPFRGLDTAEKRAAKLGDGLARLGHYPAIDVYPLAVGATPTRDVAELVR